MRKGEAHPSGHASLALRGYLWGYWADAQRHPLPAQLQLSPQVQLSPQAQRSTLGLAQPHEALSHLQGFWFIMSMGSLLRGRLHCRPSL